VVIINQTMARMYWPTGDPLNDSLIIGRGVRPDYLHDPIRRIIGIVGDVRDQTLRNRPGPKCMSLSRKFLMVLHR
jgi:putative ABC transport system permease protein